jgi:DNA-binding PadR family transcriptional regulator
MADLESGILDQIRERTVKNFMDVMILMELGKHQMSCYDIISSVNNRFHLLLSPGTVYSNLYSLERNGLVNGKRSQGRRVYTLTEQGRQTVRAFIDAKDEILGLVLNLFFSE